MAQNTHNTLGYINNNKKEKKKRETERKKRGKKRGHYLLCTDWDLRDNPFLESGTVLRVPRIITAEPWGNVSEGREEEVNGPGDDGVVVPRHEGGHHADRDTDACKERTETKTNGGNRTRKL